MSERAYRWSVAQDCWHYWLGDCEPVLESAAARAGRDRIIPSEDKRAACEVADRHWPFVVLLRDMSLELLVVLEGERAYLGVHCANNIELRRRTIDIFRALQRRPKLRRALNRDLGLWRYRELLSGRFALFWPGVGLRQTWKH